MRNYSQTQLITGNQLLVTRYVQVWFMRTMTWWIDEHSHGDPSTCDARLAYISPPRQTGLTRAAVRVFVSQWLLNGRSVGRSKMRYIPSQGMPRSTAPSSKKGRSFRCRKMFQSKHTAHGKRLQPRRGWPHKQRYDEIFLQKPFKGRLTHKP